MAELIPQFITVFLLTVIFAVFFLPVLRRIKASQTILHYVKEHSSKQGTPTMGGIIFLLPVLVVFVVAGGRDSGRFASVALAIAAGYGIVGFLDDFIKVYFRRNLGLRAYQKIFFQLIVAVIAAIFAYNNQATQLHIPFTRITADFGIYTVPLTVIAVLATTNCVNLTDGLDGLASGTSLVSLMALLVLLTAKAHWLAGTGDSFISWEMIGLCRLLVTVIAAVFAFLCFNRYPARVFMGDTGSLALGAFISVIAAFSGYTLFIPLIAIMPVVSGVSVILQVSSFKLTGKRVILMAPYHHHLQQKGIHESRISFVYAAVTIITALCVIYFSVL